MFSLIFKTIEDDASASSIRITSIFSTLHDNIKLLLSKAATESSFSFEDGFEESLNNDLDAINNYITAVQGGMSETEALASSFRDASAAAKDYANSTKFAEVNTEDYTTKAKLSQVSTLAQNKSLSNTKKLIDEYGTGLKKCGLSQEQYLLEIKKTNPQLAAYLANLHGADATLKGYIGSLFSAKAATIALQIATTALNAVIGMGIGLLLSLIASGLSALFDSIKEALRDPKEVIEELDEELSSLQSTIQSTAKDFSDLKKSSDEIIPRFAELCRGVDEFGNRLTDANGKMILTDEEYEEFWELNNKIAEMFPDLDVGIDSNGNHILSLSYSVDTLTESLEALVEAEKQAANQKIIENLDDTLENIEKAEKAYKKETTMITGKSSHLTSAYNTVKSYSDSGFSWNTSDRSDRNADRYKAKAYKDALDALGIKYTVSQSGYNTTTRMYDIENIIPDDADWDRILREYEDDLSGFSKEVEDINAKAAARWKKLDPIMGAWLQTTDSYAIATDEIQNLLSKVIGNINYGDIGITDGDELKEYLQDNVIDTLMDATPDVQDAVKRLFLNDGELSINEFESLANKIKEQFGDDNPVYLYVKSNLDDVAEEAGVVRSFVKDQTDTTELQKELDVLEQKEKSLIRLNELAEEYNSLTNGNVDYGKRPFITPEKMVASGWEDFEGDIATTFTQGATIGEGEYLYTIDVTPILEDGTVLSPEALDEYIQTLVTDNGIESILESDKYNLVINAQVGDYDPSYWEPYEEKLSEIKDEHYQLADSMGLVTEKFATDSKTELDNVSKDIARIKDEFDSSVDELSLDDLAIAASDEFWKFLNVPDGTLLSLDELNKKLKEYKELSDSIEPLSFEGALSKVNDLSSGLNELDKIYADIYNKADFDWGSILDNEAFTKAFSNLGDVYSNFIETVANSPTDIAACQEAFDNLTTAYLKQSGILDNVTDATRNATVAMLEQMGVSNAAAIVDAELACQKEKLKYTTGDYTDKTYDEIVELYNECTAGETAKQVLAELAVQKALVNAEQIKSSDDIEQIIALANAANATTASLQNLAKAKALIATAESKSAQAKNMYETQGDSRAYQRVYNQAQTAYKQAEKLLAEGVQYNEIDASKFKASYSGGSATKSAKDSAAKAAEKAAKETAKKEETWFDKQYKLHKHLVAMEQETDAEYFNWLNSAYQQAYNEGIIELDDYRKYQEEIFAGLRSLFKDYLNDIEHEISMREAFDGESKKIISLYKTLISKVEAEIAAARKQGLTDNDDYIQELQDKWKSYRKAITDIEENITDAAKDALDDLVDYRMDMLKDDIKNEKDALDKKLDNLKEFYDKQKEMLQDAADEEKYLDEQSEKRKSVTDIQSELAQLEYDNSAWAEKRKAELRQELADAQKELDDFEKDHALDMALDAIDNAYNSQEAQLQREMDALDEKLNDPNALYNQALTDIKNNSKNQLYYTMLMYNRQYGTGKDSDIIEMWEKAYGALDEYQKTFGKAYEGVTLKNETGVKANTETWDTAKVSGTNPANKATTTTTTTTTKPATTTPKLDDATKRKVAAAIWNGNYGWGTGSTRSSRLTEVFGANNGIQALVNQGVGKKDGAPGNDYTYLNMRKKFKGYASGTRNATAGWHAIDELGDEYVFTSSDGTRYKMLNSGDHVLNAEATDFLYDFANGGQEILEKIIKSAVGGLFDKIVPIINNNDIDMGGITVNGNADAHTVSEIRRAQRDNLKTMLQELQKLNK